MLRRADGHGGRDQRRTTGRARVRCCSRSADAERVRLLHQLRLAQGPGDRRPTRTVALHFGWYPLHRQVRVEGRGRRVSRGESEAYFATRPRGSQLGAWASAQSSEVASLTELTGVVRRRRGAVRRRRGALPGALGRLSGDAGPDRVLAGPAEPDARPAALPAAAIRLDPDPAGALTGRTPERAHPQTGRRRQRGISGKWGVTVTGPSERGDESRGLRTWPRRSGPARRPS